MPVTTKERILMATRALYLEHGEGGVTMRRVAQTVGLSPTALYRHFDNRDALVAEVVSDGFRVFGSYLYRSLKGRTPEERLEMSGGAYLDFALEQTEIYRTIFLGRPSAGFPDSETGPHDARQAATFRSLVDRVEECLGSGFLVEGEPDEIALTIWAHVHGLISLYIAGALREDEEAFRAGYARSLERLFRGLARRPPTG